MVLVRYRRHDTGQTTEFRILDVPDELLPAVRKAAFTAGDGHWSRSFPADTAHLDRAWVNFQRLAGPALRQIAALEPVPWQQALSEVCRRLGGAGVDWVGGVGPGADQPEISDFGLVAAARLEAVPWQGHEIRVPPLKLQRAVSARRGLAERVRLIDRRTQTTRP
jgi:hypothetical protein